MVNEAIYETAEYQRAMELLHTLTPDEEYRLSVRFNIIKQEYLISFTKETISPNWWGVPELARATEREAMQAFNRWLEDQVYARNEALQQEVARLGRVLP